MSTRQDVDSFLDFLRATFVDTGDKESSPLSATSTLRSFASDATLGRRATFEPVIDIVPEACNKLEQREKEKPVHIRRIPILSHLRRAPKPGVRSSSLPTKNLTGGLPAIR